MKDDKEAKEEKDANEMKNVVLKKSPKSPFGNKNEKEGIKRFKKRIKIKMGKKMKKQMKGN